MLKRKKRKETKTAPGPEAPRVETEKEWPPIGTEVSLPGRWAETDGVTHWMEPIGGTIRSYHRTEAGAFAQVLTKSGCRAARVAWLMDPESMPTGRQPVRAQSGTNRPAEGHTMKTYTVEGSKGCMLSKKSRRTGLVYNLHFVPQMNGNAKKVGVDWKHEEFPYAMECPEHSTVIPFAKQRPARRTIALGEFCPKCAETLAARMEKKDVKGWAKEAVSRFLKFAKTADANGTPDWKTEKVPSLPKPKKAPKEKDPAVEAKKAEARSKVAAKVAAAKGKKEKEKKAPAPKAKAKKAPAPAVAKMSTKRTRGPRVAVKAPKAKGRK